MAHIFPPEDPGFRSRRRLLGVIVGRSRNPELGVAVTIASPFTASFSARSVGETRATGYASE